MHNRQSGTAQEQLQSSSALTFARSLFHAAEGKELFDQRFVFASAVSTYYSLFHLGSTLILAYCSHPASTNDPHASMRSLLAEKWERSHSVGSPNTNPYAFPDPAEGIRHDDVPAFLKRELPEIFQSLGNRNRRGTLRDMREFVNYAPRMVSDGHINILYSGCQYEAQDFQSHLHQHLGRIDQFFCNAAAWIGRGCNEVYSRIVSGDFILFEFGELRSYHPESVAKRAWGIYRSICDRGQVDWSIYHPDPEIWRTDEPRRRERYVQVISSLQ